MGGKWMDGLPIHWLVSVVSGLECETHGLIFCPRIALVVSAVPLYYVTPQSIFD